MSAKPVPEGHNVVSPYLVVKGADKLIEFAKRVFGAEVVARMEGPGGAVMHAEIRIGDTIVMIGEAGETLSPAMLHVYVADVDTVYRRALEAGATSQREPEDMFYGDRISTVADAFGNRWAISTHKEDVSHEEMARRAAQAKR
jgi:PhnB protein